MHHHPVTPSRQATPAAGKKDTETQYHKIDPNQDGVTEYVTRNLFIGKVLSILTCCQLMSTSAIAITAISPVVQVFIFENHWIGWLCLLVSMQITIFLDLFPQLRSRVPYNLALLILLTLTQSVIMATLATNLDTPTMLIAMTIVCVSTGTVSIIALYAIFDMTYFVSHIAVSVYVLCCVEFGLFTVCPHFCPYIPIFDRIAGGCIALLYCAFDGGVVQMITEQMELKGVGDIEDYAGSVLLLNFDVVNVTLNMLKIIVGTAARKEQRQRQMSYAS